MSDSNLGRDEDTRGRGGPPRLPLPAELVRVRSRQYLVEAVEPGGSGEQTRPRLSCLEVDAEGAKYRDVWST